MKEEIAESSEKLSLAHQGDLYKTQGRRGVGPSALRGTHWGAWRCTAKYISGSSECAVYVACSWSEVRILRSIYGNSWPWDILFLGEIAGDHSVLPGCISVEERYSKFTDISPTEFRRFARIWWRFIPQTVLRRRRFVFRIPLLALTLPLMMRSGNFKSERAKTCEWGCPITRRSFGGATMHSSHPISRRLEQTTRYLRNDLTGWLERMVAPPRDVVLWLPHWIRVFPNILPKHCLSDVVPLTTPVANLSLIVRRLYWTQ